MTHAITQTSCARPSARPPLSLWAQMSRMIDLARQRRALAALDADQLCDIGLTHKDAKIEAARPPWDAPSHWHR